MRFIHGSRLRAIVIRSGGWAMPSIRRGLGGLLEQVPDLDGDGGRRSGAVQRRCAGCAGAFGQGRLDDLELRRRTKWSGRPAGLVPHEPPGRRDAASPPADRR